MRAGDLPRGAERVDTKLENELRSFQDLWEGGFFEGDPLDPMGRSGYGQLGFMSVLHATYLTCIKPYVTPLTVALELGPGRGAWTKALLPAKEVWCLDALSAEHNRFNEYLGHPRNVRYFQVSDLNCTMLPDDYFTYMFSFGCLCHVSFDGIEQYARNLYPKLRRGSNCFWMVADYSKYNEAVKNIDRFSIWPNALPRKRRYSPARWLAQRIARMSHVQLQHDTDNIERPGRWYDSGIERTVSMLQSVGYRIVDPDVGVNHRDPVIHFAKD